MSSIKIISLMISMVAILIITNGCAFGDRHLTLKPVYAEDLSTKTVVKDKIQVTPPEDVRNNQQALNFVGYVRNGYGMHTADVLGDKNVDEWVQSCITENLKKAGFNVAAGKTATKGLSVSTSIRSLECDTRMSLKATVILDVKLKKDNSTFFEQSFTGEASKTSLLMSSEGYNEVLTKAMKQCLDKMMPVLIKEMEKKAKTQGG